VAKDRYGLWSPHRDSRSVLSFKSMLGLRPQEVWVWHDQPELATWWIIDGARSDVAAITQMLIREKTQEPTHGAILAEEWSVVKNPIWTFFKIPLKPQLIYNWVNATQQRMGPATVSFAGRKLKLRRWPNMSRYSNGLSMAQSISLTTACAQALKDSVSYSDMLTLAGKGNDSTLHALLHDALQDGILEVSVVEGIVETIVETSSTNNPTSDTKRWSLIRRLIEKFS
jgi:hypothetical protein